MVFLVLQWVGGSLRGSETSYTSASVTITERLQYQAVCVDDLLMVTAKSSSGELEGCQACSPCMHDVKEAAGQLFGRQVLVT